MDWRRVLLHNSPANVVSLKSDKNAGEKNFKTRASDFFYFQQDFVGFLYEHIPSSQDCRNSTCFDACGIPTCIPFPHDDVIVMLYYDDDTVLDIVVPY